ncbi:MAG TPA: phage holin family protein [Anaerolineales bacterium]|nr:phage holin family protein [Anaerolineales bacterium]
MKVNQFLIRWGINIVGLYVAVLIVPGVTLASGDWLGFVWLALIFGLLNALVRPFLMLLTCPLIILTLGLGTLLLNTVMMYLLEWASDLFDLGFDLAGFWPAFLGAIVVTLVSVAMTMVFKDELKKK